MSWLFSQALVEEYLVDTSLVGEQSVQSNGKPTQQAYCAPDKMTDFSRLSRFGMMYKPLTENLGDKLLMLYLEDFHAKICPQQVQEKVLTENDQDSGKKWHGWLAKYNQDSCLWKTAQCSLITDSEEFLEIYPTSGLMRDGLLWEQTKLAHHIKETEFGYLPTPVASDCKGGTSNTVQYKNQKFVRISLTTGTQFGAKLSAAYQLMIGKNLPPIFSEWMMGWPIGWTDLKPLAMDKSLCAPQQHGNYSVKEFND